jgi:hypothetical protein
MVVRPGALAVPFAVSAALAAGAPAPAPAAEPAEEIFVDRAAEVGIDFVHTNGMSGELYFAEMMGQGAALFDYDNDGDLDAYLVQGAPLGEGEAAARAAAAAKHPLPLSDRLYRNDLEVRPDGSRVLRFTDVTEESGIARLALGYGMGVAAGDYDNDGWTDLYLTNLGPNQMLRNRGPGPDGVTFEDATAATGTGDPLWGVPAVFFDYDRDGWLDLFVGNYVDFRIATHKPCSSPAGALDYCSPSAFRPEPDRLFHNLGADGGGARFEDVTRRAGLHAEFGSALGAAAADFDGDGWLDLYVANDGNPNQLWLNQRDGTFENGALLGGCAVNEEGQPQASMGVVTGDLDGDGSEDLFLTHLDRETNALYLNDGAGMFEDRSQESGLGAPSWPYTGFGVALLDYDGDGWQDLFVANGAVTRIEEQVRAGEPYPLRQKNQLFRALGGGRFEETTARAGEVFALSEVSRGVAAGDVDNDGDPDVLMSNSAGPARLLIGQAGQGRPWLGLRLVGGDPPRDQLGARVALHRAGARTLWRHARTDGSYASAGDPRALFRLGDGAAVERAVVRWPSGRVEEFRDLPLGRYTTLREGSGKRLE